MNNTLQECYEYYVDLRTEIDQWLKQSMVLDPPGPNGGGEDEANYALAWFPHYLVTGDKTVLKHFGNLKSALAGWIERECLHGYEPGGGSAPRHGAVSAIPTAIHRSCAG